VRNAKEGERRAQDSHAEHDQGGRQMTDLESEEKARGHDADRNGGEAKRTVQADLDRGADERAGGSGSHDQQDHEQEVCSLAQRLRRASRSFCVRSASSVRSRSSSRATPTSP